MRDTAAEAKSNPSLGKDREMGEGGASAEAQRDGSTPVSAMRRLWAATTYEPLFLLHSIAFYATMTMTESLISDKSCLVTLGKPEEICRDLYNHPHDAIEVQQVASKYQGIVPLAESFVSIFLLLYIGPFSDRYGRKPFLYLSLAMRTLNVLLLFFASAFIYSPIELTVAAPFIYSLGGGIATFLMLVFACISDVTTDANRTYRLGILKICMAFGSPTGRVVGGQVFAVGGYLAVYGMSLAIMVVCLIILAFTEESVKFGENEVRPKLKISRLVEEPASLFAAVHRREGPRRGIVYGVLFAHICMFFALNPLYFLFFKLMFDWDATDYSNWFFYKDMTKAIGKLFAAQAVLDSIAVGLSGPMYAAVYSSTVDSLPVAQFLLAALFMLLSAVGIWVCDIFVLKKEAGAKNRDN